jgi:uncharacterized protein (DUF1499 family)
MNSTELGVKNGMLFPCNGKWNCAITQSVDGQKPNAQSLYYTGSKKEAQIWLKKIILSFARTKIITETEDYVHATFESKFWHFVDDVEFYFAEHKPIIYMRSASRVGTYDFGVNKRRLKKIKKMFEK